jgi:hypothetical protein
MHQKEMAWRLWSGTVGWKRVGMLQLLAFRNIELLQQQHHFLDECI